MSVVAEKSVGYIANEWKSGRLGDFVTLQRGFDLPKRLRENGLVPIVTSSGIEDFHSESKVTRPGVVTGRYGTIGNVFYLTQDFWPLNTTLFVSDFHGNDPLYPKPSRRHATSFSTTPIVIATFKINGRFDFRSSRGWTHWCCRPKIVGDISMPFARDQ